VLAVSTESRDLPPSEIRRAVAAVAAAFADCAAARVFRKIDSTLRGNTGVDVAAAVDAFGCEAAVVCPAFPKMQRLVEGGILRVTSAPEFAPIDVAGRLQRQGGHAYVHTGPEGVAAALAGRVRFISVDANCDEDLDRIAAAIFPIGRRILWVGSAGLAAALARRLGTVRASRPRHTRRGPVLFCLGSDHPVTMAQQAALVAERQALLLHPAQAASDRIGKPLAVGQHVILRIPWGLVPPEQVSAWIGSIPAAALVLSGGDTASLVCRALGVQRIELCDEIVAGLPHGILRGGECNGRPVATKSGGFGDRDALMRVADFFHASTNERAPASDSPDDGRPGGHRPGGRPAGGRRS